MRPADLLFTWPQKSNQLKKMSQIAAKKPAQGQCACVLCCFLNDFPLSPLTPMRVPLVSYFVRCSSGCYTPVRAAATPLSPAKGGKATSAQQQQQVASPMRPSAKSKLTTSAATASDPAVSDPEFFAQLRSFRVVETKALVDMVQTIQDIEGREKKLKVCGVKRN